MPLKVIDAGASIDWLFGDGSDGDVVMSTNGNLSRDMYYNNLTIDATKTLTTYGHRVFVRGTLTLNGNVSAAGLAGDQGSLSGGGHVGVGTSGGAQPRGGSYIVATGAANSLGGAGGASGANAGGTATVPSGANGGAHAFGDLRCAITGRTVTGVQVTGGGGGAGGVIDTGTGGAGGGTGGCVLVLCARKIVGAGLITARGGNGIANATGAGSGGAGGGGGVVVLVSTTDVPPAQINVDGGTGVAGSVGVTAGANGAAGNVFKFIV